MLKGRWCLLKVKINNALAYDIAEINIDDLQISLITEALNYPSDSSKLLDGCVNMSRQRWSYYRKKHKQRKVILKDLSISVLQDLIMIGINIQNLTHKEGKRKNE